MLFMMAVKYHISINSLPFYIMGITHHGTFYHACMHIDGIFYFCCSNTMAAYIQHIIHPSGNPVKPIFILHSTVTCEI